MAKANGRSAMNRAVAGGGPPVVIAPPVTAAASVPYRPSR